MRLWRGDTDRTESLATIFAFRPSPTSDAPQAANAMIKRAGARIGTDTVINFDDDALEAYLAEDDGAPVVMLNLLRFGPDGGAEKYASYAEQFELTGLYVKYGVELVYAGLGSTTLIAEDGQTFDTVLLVRYPSRRHFVDMVRDPVYLQFEHLRTEALDAAVLQATTPLSFG